MLSFYLLEKRLGIVSPRDFLYDFFRKMFYMLIWNKNVTSEKRVYKSALEF